MCGCSIHASLVSASFRVSTMKFTRYRGLHFATIVRVKARQIHPWNISPGEAVDIQRQLADQVVIQSFVREPELVAGLDISGVGPDGRATAAVVVLSYPELDMIECRIASSEVAFPYVPGLLSFRETPVLTPLLESLTAVPDVLLIDGQGIAHPRRFGIACHLGLIFDIPTIGCAKSRLTGSFEEPAPVKGSHTMLMDGEEAIGAAVRTRDGTRPIFVSVGHKIDLESALGIVLACAPKYRIPEPTRRAHLAAAGKIASFIPGKGC